MKELTTAQAAEACVMSVGSFRAHMSRERKRGLDLRVAQADWPDLRTPLYDGDAVVAWAANRARKGTS